MKTWRNIVIGGVFFLGLSLVASVARAQIVNNGGGGGGGGGTINVATTFNKGITVNGGIADTGSVSVAAIGTPSAPSIVSGFTSGTTDYYFCVAADLNYTITGLGVTVPSAGTGTTGTTGTMSCGGQTGAVIYALLRTASSSVPSGSSTFLVGTCATTSGVACQIADAGNVLTSFVAVTGDATGVVTARNVVVGASNFQSGANSGTIFASQYVIGPGSVNLITPGSGILDNANGGFQGSGYFSGLGQQFNLIYSVAGTAVPTCNSGTNHVTVCTSDATLTGGLCVQNTAYGGSSTGKCAVTCVSGTGWLETGSIC